MKKIISLLLCFLLLMPSLGVFAETTGEVTDGTGEEQIEIYETVDDVIEAAETLGAETLTISKNIENGKHYYQGAVNKVTHTDLTDSADGKEYCRMQITSLGSGAKASSIQSRYLASGVDVEEGDIIFLAFKVRAVSSNHSTGCVIGTGYYRMTSTGSSNASVGFRILPPEEGEEAEWVWVYKAATAKYAHTADKAAHIDFILGNAVQTVDIKDITVINFKDKIELASLPKKESTYEGMEDDAEWRKAANERIEQIRKSDVKVKVIDSNGDPISGAKVNIDQTKHAFKFGSYMPLGRIIEDESTTSSDKIKNKAFQEQFKKMFNTTGFENVFKPGNIVVPENQAKIQKVIEFADENDMNLRGHTLVWREGDALSALEKTNPTKHTEYENGDAATKNTIMRDFIEDHITTYTLKYGEYIDSWDVVNEFLNHKDEIYTVIGGDMEEVARWFELARVNTGDANLVLNDFGIISLDETAQNSHYDLAKKLKDLGAPITTVGMQAHLGGAISPAYIIDIFNKFQDLGLDIEITEFTYENSNETVQANYVRDFLTAVFSHPSASSIYLWGFAENEIGNRQSSALCRQFDWNTRTYPLKPSGEQWMDLIYNKWWTKEEGTTSEEGLYNTRAFHGKHNITVTIDGVTKSFPIELGATSKEYVFNYDEGTYSEATGEFDEKGLRISLDEATGGLMVEGNSIFGGGADATVLINDSEGRIVYFDQVPRLATDGSFSISAKTSNFLSNDGQYTVKIGSQGKNCVKFWLSGDASIYDYKIKSVNYTKGSDKISSFGEISANDTVTAEVKLETNSVQTIFMGIFDEDGNLLKVSNGDSEITGTDEVTCTASVSMENTAGGTHIKLFVWDGVNNMIPFTEVLLLD